MSTDPSPFPGPPQHLLPPAQSAPGAFPVPGGYAGPGPEQSTPPVPVPYGANRPAAPAAPIEELLVTYDAGPLTEKVTRRRRGVRSRLVSLVITAVILVLLYFFGPESLRAGGFLALFGVALGVSVAWFLGYLVAYLLARRERKGLGSGTAVRIGRPGVQVAGVFSPWAEVTSLGMTTSRFGRRPRLQLRSSNGATAAVPLNQMVVLPATLDSTARAYSGGRHGVDLTALDS